MENDMPSYCMCARVLTLVSLLTVGCNCSTASSLPATDYFLPSRIVTKVHSHGTMTAKSTRSDDGNNFIVEGADKTSINVLAPSMPTVLCAIKQEPSAIASLANTCLSVHSRVAHTISLVLLAPSSLIMRLPANLAVDTRRQVESLLEPGAGSLGPLGNVNQMS